ncbi:Wall-associated receptor kinase 2 [Carex littledalei]|uniref:Wall-associated receptor kinase 2 n=1 Tax=Carex littledalei TaxID=544730 RepID=A0A833RGW2_9POAL|nr:Wall-associated receptor kinase 2 [Carex littledalei]
MVYRFIGGMMKERKRMSLQAARSSISSTYGGGNDTSTTCSSPPSVQKHRICREGHDNRSARVPREMRRETLIEHGSSSCSGIGCCQTTIPKGTSSFLFSFDERINRSEVYNFNRCSFAMLVEEAKFNFSTAYVTNDELLDNPTLPMVINWAIGNGNTTCEHAQTDKSSYACISSNSNCTTISGRDF